MRRRTGAPDGTAHPSSLTADEKAPSGGGNRSGPEKEEGLAESPLQGAAPLAGGRRGTSLRGLPGLHPARPPWCAGSVSKSKRRVGVVLRTRSSVHGLRPIRARPEVFAGGITSSGHRRGGDPSPADLLLPFPVFQRLLDVRCPSEHGRWKSESPGSWVLGLESCVLSRVLRFDASSLSRFVASSHEHPMLWPQLRHL